MESSNKHLLMIAGSDIDTFYNVESFIGAGDACMCELVGKKVGGCTLNVAVVAAAKGLDVKAIDYLKADDEDSRMLIDELNRKKVDTSYFQFDRDATNGSCLIMKKDEERCIYVIEPRRPFYRIDERFKDLLFGSLFIYSLAHTLRISFENMDILKEAKKHGAKLIFDASGQYSDLRDRDMLYELADGAFINRKSYERLKGVSGGEPKDILLNNGALFVAVTDGDKGARLYTKEKEYYAEAMKIDALDTTGAGDSFAGCFLACLAEGYDYETALHLASANGAYACMKEGGMAGAVSFEEVRDFAKTASYKTE